MVINRFLILKVIHNNYCRKFMLFTPYLILGENMGYHYHNLSDKDVVSSDLPTIGSWHLLSEKSKRDP